MASIMRPVFRQDYRTRTYFTTTLENTLLPINAGGTTIEVLINIIEIPGPIWAGERWDIFCDVTGQNPGHETAGTFLRTELWIDESPTVHQNGDRSFTASQTGTYNMGNEAEFAQVYREGNWVFSTASMGSRWAKLFCAANSTVGLPDSVIQNAALGVKRFIPL